MIEERAKVIAVKDGAIQLQMIKTRSCDSCNAKNACGHALLARMTKRNHPHNTTEFSLPNRLDAQVGDQVVLGIAEDALLKAALLVYLLPLLALLAGAMLGKALWASEVAAITGGLLGLLAGFMLIPQLQSAIFSSSSALPQLLRIDQSTDAIKCH